MKRLMSDRTRFEQLIRSLWLTCVSWFQTTTLPLYRLTSIHGSVGCRSTLLTRSDREVSLRLMSNRRGYGWGKERIECMIIEEESDPVTQQLALNQGIISLSVTVLDSIMQLWNRFKMTVQGRSINMQLNSNRLCGQSKGGVSAASHSAFYMHACSRVTGSTQVFSCV